MSTHFIILNFFHLTLMQISTITLQQVFIFPYQTYLNVLQSSQSLVLNSSKYSCEPILPHFNYTFRNTISTVILPLCDSIIMKSSSDWLGVLPLIHATKLPEFKIGQPYKLGITTEQNIVQHLFCGLQVEKFQTTDPK